MTRTKKQVEVERQQFLLRRGKHLGDVLRERNISQQQFALDIDASRPTISKFINHGLAGDELISRIAEQLDLPWEEVCTGRAVAEPVDYDRMLNAVQGALKAVDFDSPAMKSVVEVIYNETS